MTELVIQCIVICAASYLAVKYANRRRRQRENRAMKIYLEKRGL
jgi:hypothetical protein